MIFADDMDSIGSMLVSEEDKVSLIALGARLKSIRQAKNLSLQQLAIAINKDPQSIHRVEQGQVNPTYIYLLQVCRGLEIDIKELL